MPWIYGLVSSAEPARVRYVGKTAISIERRLTEHISDAKRYTKTHKQKWIRSVWARGAEVFAVELEEISQELLNAAECRWIVELSKTSELVNGTVGGDGGVTRTGPISEEHKEKYRQGVIAGWARRGAPTEAQLSAVRKNIELARVAAVSPLTRKKAADTIKARRWSDGRICPICGVLFSGLPYKTKHRKNKVCSWDCKKIAISRAQKLRHTKNGG